jgi:zinc transport system ATP-binding protein
MKTKRKAKTISASSKTTSASSALRSHASNVPLLDVDDAGITLGGNAVLKDVSFCLHRGEFVGLIGPNGAGKTTLVRTVLGLVPLTTGTITKSPQIVAGYIQQRGFMHDSQTPISVREVVSLGARGDAQKIHEALKAVSLSDFATARFGELSGGQQQRVLIAKALASQPNLLILDEPTTGIDERSQTEFYDILSRLHAEGMTILMISHDVDTVLKVVTRVMCLNQTILYDGPSEHFEADKYLPRFYGQQHRILHHQHGGWHA